MFTIGGSIKSIAEDHGCETVGEGVRLGFPSLDGRGEGEGGKGLTYHLSATGVSPWVSTFAGRELFVTDFREREGRIDFGSFFKGEGLLGESK